MNVLPVGIALCLVSVHAFAAGNSSLYTGLTDMNQNPAFRPKLLAAPASSFKLAKVHFVQTWFYMFVSIRQPAA